ncbi:hypothetical protein ACFE04_004967 [Oxalis oulophora]
MEELMINLTQIVAKLDSKLSESRELSVKDDQLGVTHQQNDKVFDGKSVEETEIVEVDDDGKVEDSERGGPVSVTKYSRFWSEKFQFVSAVKLDFVASCINVLPDRDSEGLIKYVAVGDENGRVYLFSRMGDVLFEFHSLCESKITAMVSYMSVYRNESVVVTGHQNGVILMHRVYEKANGEELSPPVMERVGQFETGDSGLLINFLEVHHIGRLRYILSTDTSGEIRVFKDNGTLFGSVMPKSKPLAFLKQRLMFLTETGAGALDLKSMKIKESECEGLNQSLARNFAFDAVERSKAYGFTSDGDLIHVLVLGDVTNFKCRVRSKKKLDVIEPLAFQVIKGYLIVMDEKRVFVFNVSAHHYARTSGPRLLFSVDFDEIRSSFLNYNGKDMDVDVEERRGVIPLIASDREKLVVLGLGHGYVGIYRSNLPVFKAESNTMLWTSPVLFFIIFLFVSYQFFAKKKDVLTSWGPDDPFSSTSMTNVDTPSRSGEVMDLRSGGLRGPTPASTRYGSASTYSGGPTSSFRSNPVDSNPRPASVEPNYRPPSDLRYRGSVLESSAFPNRRESLYVNSQVVDESN